MDQKILFRELLGEIRGKAVRQGRRISRTEVEQFFAHADLTTEQIDLICQYLTEQYIEVAGFEKPGTFSASEKTEQAGPPLSKGSAGSGREMEDSAGESRETKGSAGSVGKTKDHTGQGRKIEDDPGTDRRAHPLEIYLEQIALTDRPDAAAELELFHRAAGEDAAAKEQLGTVYLETVYDLAAEYEGEEIPVEDLVQEGNLGLLLALERLEKMDSLAAYRAFLLNEINQSFKQAIAESKDRMDMGSLMLLKVRRLDEAMQSLMEDLGRKVTVEELASYLEMPVPEVIAVANLAGDELEFADNSGSAKAPGFYDPLY